MKNQALFSLKDKSKNLKCRLLQILFGALRFSLSQQEKWTYRNWKLNKSFIYTVNIVTHMA